MRWTMTANKWLMLLAALALSGCATLAPTPEAIPRQAVHAAPRLPHRQPHPDRPSTSPAPRPHHHHPRMMTPWGATLARSGGAFSPLE
jgi:hypothetical protein